MAVKINNDQCTLDTPEREARFNEIRAFGCEKEYLENRKSWHENPEKHFVADFPLHVDLELSSICNLHCPFCVTGTEEFKEKVPRKYMDVALAKKIIDEGVRNGLFSLRLSWIGEPTLNPHFLDILRYAKDQGIHEVSMLTHGKKFIDRKFCEDVIDAGIDWVTFSVDAVDEAYEAIRMPIKFPQIVQALRNVMEIKKERNLVKPAIKIQGVWTEVNKNLDKYMDIFTPLSDLIYTNPLIEYVHDPKDIAKIEYVDNFTCYQPFQRLVIRSNGDAVMCANDEFGESIMGNANTMTIKEIWHGEPMKKVRTLHINHEGHKKIKACTTCHVPRAREDEEATVHGRKVSVQNYKPIAS